MPGSLIVVTGPPGAGKSTAAEGLVAHLDPSVLVQGDAFYWFLRCGAVEPWLPEAHHQNQVVTAAAARTAVDFAVGGYHTVFDGIVGPWFLAAFVEPCRDAGIDLDYVVLLPPAEVCVERVKDRAEPRFDDAAATLHMHGAFESADVAEAHLLRQPFDNGAETVHAIEAARRSGRLRVGAVAPGRADGG